MHINNIYNRRDFVRLALAGASILGAAAFAACGQQDSDTSHITGSIVGPDAATGHLLRDPGKLPRPNRNVQADVLIIGAGISGLSAKRWLHKNGYTDVMLLEMANHYGGNAHFGQNKVSAYPWGAHYITTPDLRNTELLDFLHQANVITGYDVKGLPIYNEYYMCFDPEERLFFNGLWQEGVIPNAGIGDNDRKQIKEFLELMSGYKSAIGADGRDAFRIPLDLASTDAIFRELDTISFNAFLAQKGFTSPYLLWYLEYCCKDDYGLLLNNTSAWAGVHYFACRKGVGSNANDATVLTWPEGNGFLAQQLLGQAPDNLHLSQLVYQLELNNAGALVSVYDAVAGSSYIVAAKKVILCSPQYVNTHILGDLIPAKRRELLNQFHYTPWVIANITAKTLPLKRGTPLCWDNVIYGTPSVGYVNNSSQDVSSVSKRNVLTYYLPLADHTPAEAREIARSKTYQDWLAIIVKELEYAHPGIASYIEHVDIWIWGHGMIAPEPGLIWGEGRLLAGEPIENTLFFAHSDLSGVSIFEEAFYQGIKAAKQVMAAI